MSSEVIEMEVGKWVRPFPRVEPPDPDILKQLLYDTLDPDERSCDIVNLASTEIEFRSLTGQINLYNIVAGDLEDVETPLGSISAGITITNGKREVRGIPVRLEIVLNIDNHEAAERLRGIGAEFLLGGKVYFYSSFSENPDSEDYDEWIEKYNGDEVSIFNDRLENPMGVRKNVLLPFDPRDLGRLSEIKFRFIERQTPVAEAALAA